MLGCTVFDNGTSGTNSGVDLQTNTIPFEIGACILTSNSAYGLDTSGGTDARVRIRGPICYNGNTTNPTDLAGNVFPSWGYTHIAADPVFASTTANAEDLTPTNANLYKTIVLPAGGTTYEYIGAIQPQASGGGDSFPFPGIWPTP